VKKNAGLSDDARVEPQGNSIPNANIETWEADADGYYDTQVRPPSSCFHTR
jgi:protocatechuate 3,4-dioxygenase beta subunit